MTFLLYGGVAALTLRGDITGQEFMIVFTVGISFYFETQVQKRADEEKYDK